MIPPGKSYARLDVSLLVNVPEILKRGPLFVCWREAVRAGKGTKIPIDPRTGREAKSNNPATWATWAEAVAYYQAHPDTLAGIGRMFYPVDGIIGIDFDNCLDEQGHIIPGSLAAEWLPKLNSYSEVSPSGKGVKVWVRAAHALKGKKSGRTNRKVGVEIYRERRFFTITGRRLQ